MNIYAHFVIEADGSIRFDKWVEGGERMEVVLDNKTKPPVVIIKLNP